MATVGGAGACLAWMDVDGATKRDSQDAKAAKELCQADKTPANVVERVLVTVQTEVSVETCSPGTIFDFGFHSNGDPPEPQRGGCWGRSWHGSLVGTGLKRESRDRDQDQVVDCSRKSVAPHGPRLHAEGARGSTRFGHREMGDIGGRSTGDWASSETRELGKLLLGTYDVWFIWRRDTVSQE